MAGEEWISAEHQQLVGGAAIQFVNQWLEGVLGNGDFDVAWKAMDEPLRLATAQSAGSPQKRPGKSPATFPGRR